MKILVKKVKHIVDSDDHTINVVGYYVAYPEASLHCGEKCLGTPMSSETTTFLMVTDG